MKRIEVPLARFWCVVFFMLAMRNVFRITEDWTWYDLKFVVDCALFVCYWPRAKWTYSSHYHAQVVNNTVMGAKSDGIRIEWPTGSD